MVRRRRGGGGRGASPRRRPVSSGLATPHPPASPPPRRSQARGAAAVRRRTAAQETAAAVCLQPHERAWHGTSIGSRGGLYAALEATALPSRRRRAAATARPPPPRRWVRSGASGVSESRRERRGGHALKAARGAAGNAPCWRRLLLSLGGETRRQGNLCGRERRRGGVGDWFDCRRGREEVAGFGRA